MSSRGRIRPDETLYGAVRYKGKAKPLAEIAIATYFTGIDLVPAGTFLMEIEYEVARVIGDRRYEKFFNRLPRVLKEVGAHYDVIVLDTAPNLGFATLGSMCSATGLILTIHPHMLDTLSARQYLAMFTQTMKTLIDAGAAMNLAFVRYLFTRREINDHAQSKIVTLLRSLFEDRFLHTEVFEVGRDRRGTARKADPLRRAKKHPSQVDRGTSPRVDERGQRRN